MATKLLFITHPGRATPHQIFEHAPTGAMLPGLSVEDAVPPAHGLFVHELAIGSPAGNAWYFDWGRCRGYRWPTGDCSCIGGFAETGVGAPLLDLAVIYGPLVDDRRLAIEAIVPEGLVYPLHRELLSQVIGHITENVLKYAQGAQHIVLTARHIADSGLVLALVEAVAPACGAMALEDNAPGLRVVLSIKA